MTTKILKDSTIVFIGPTLNVTNAKKICPKAIFLPPIQCGDIYSIFRLGIPKAIGIIDGYFETVPSIWHKEIMYAIHKGTHVFGAGSMGALRAAELETLGMIGVGKIFQAFKTKVYRDDGEVAVVHGPSEFNYPVLTDALVNIRATVSKAVDEKVISENLAAHIIEQAIKTFYQQRKLELIISAMPSTKELESFKKWVFHEKGYVDQKALDAIELLNHLNNEQLSFKPIAQKALQPIWTGWTSTLFRYVDCRPIQIKADWLPPEEKIAQISRLFGRKYFLARKFAIGLSYVYSSIDPQDITSNENENWLNLITSGKDHNVWFQENDIDDIEGFKQRYSKIFTHFHHTNDHDIQNCKHLLRFFGFYNPTIEPKNNILMLLSYLGKNLTTNFNKFGYKTASNQANLFLFSQDYYDFLGLESQEKLETWLQENDLKSSPEYNEFIQYIYNFERVFDLVNPIFAHPLMTNSEEINWYLEALKISGLYQEIKESLKGQLDNNGLRKYWENFTAKQRENQAILADLGSWEEVTHLLDTHFGTNK